MTSARFAQSDEARETHLYGRNRDQLSAVHHAHMRATQRSRQPAQRLAHQRETLGTTSPTDWHRCTRIALRCELRAAKYACIRRSFRQYVQTWEPAATSSAVYTAIAVLCYLHRPAVAQRRVPDMSDIWTWRYSRGDAAQQAQHPAEHLSPVGPDFARAGFG